MEQVFLFGAGGHGRAVAEVIRREGRCQVVSVLDDDPRSSPPPGLGELAGGRECLQQLAGQGVRAGVIAIGNNADRELVSTLVVAAGLSLVTVIDPSAVVASDARIGPGSVLMPFSFAGAATSIGRCSIVNTGASVDHDCAVGDFVHIAVGSRLVGGCSVGSRSFIGAGAVLGRPVTLGERVTIGAGSAVIDDVSDGVVAVGVPARGFSGSP